MIVAIANDHRGVTLKNKIIKYLMKRNVEIKNLGTDTKDSVDYPDYAFKLGEVIVNKEADLGIAICGSGIGISIACNKVKGIRCAKINNYKEAKYSIIDNNANVFALSEKTSYIKLYDILDVIIKTKHPVNERHDRRINKITEYEKDTK